MTENVVIPADELDALRAELSAAERDLEVTRNSRRSILDGFIRANAQLTVAQTRIAVLEKALADAKISHASCEDPWYSCPLSVDGCADDREIDCNCGATKHNALIDVVLSQPAKSSGEQS